MDRTEAIEEYSSGTQGYIIDLKRYGLPLMKMDRIFRGLGYKGSLISEINYENAICFKICISRYLNSCDSWDSDICM